MLRSTNVAAGIPEADTVNATATPAVVLYGPAPPVNAGAVAAATFTVTVCDAVPALLLAVNVNVRAAPPSACSTRWGSPGCWWRPWA